MGAVRSGDRVETYGLNVYLPRFRPGMHVVRVGPSPVERRSPLPQITEVQASLSAIEERAPRFVVVSECYVWRYLQPDTTSDPARIVPAVQKINAHDADATRLFQALWAGQLAYHVVLEARVRSNIFPRAELHSSLGCPTFIFERDATPR